MSNDLEEQMRERRLREEARRERQRRESSGINAMDVDSGNTQPMNQESRIRELRDSINQRRQTINAMRNQIQEIQVQCSNEIAQCEREEQELRHLEGVASHTTNEASESVTMCEATQTHETSINNANVSSLPSAQAGSGSTPAHMPPNQSQQIMTDEEVARHLLAQFEREEEEEQEYLNERTIDEPQTMSQFSMFGNQDPNSSGHGGISFQFSSSNSSLPAVGSRTTIEHGTDPFSPFESFFGNDDLLTGGQPFRRTRLGGMPSLMSSRQRDDPFSAMRMFPLLTHPGLMFGGALMNENMDYETLMRLFPPAPRGAQTTDIEQLPVDRFKAKHKEQEKPGSGSENKEEEKKENKKKTEDEFSKCCICLESFKDGDEIRRLPCLHIFHTAEIDEWLVRNHLCPICRTPIEENNSQ